MFFKKNVSLKSVSSTTATVRSDDSYKDDDFLTDEDDDNDSVFGSIRTISKTVHDNEKNHKFFDQFDLVLEKRKDDFYEIPTKYNKHSYLDLNHLSIGEQLRLRWLHKTKWSNAIRCGIVIFCLLWFAINGCTILKDYLRRESLVFLEYNRPENTRPPGITICTHCVLCKYVFFLV